MEVHYFMTAKYAETSRDGSTNIIGAGVPTVQCKSLPFLLPNLYLVAKVALDRVETRSAHLVVVALIGPDGEDILRSDEMRSPAQEIPQDREYFFLNLVLAFNNVTFTRDGLFLFQLILDGELAKVFPFRLEMMQTVATSEGVRVEEGAA